MTIVLAALLLLFLVPCSFGVRGFHVDRYIGRDEIQPVKGLFLILVFASHFCQYVTLGGGLDAGYLNTRKFLGQMIVVPFLFYSGYGVVASIRRKGEAYLLSMPAQRILKVAFQFAVAVLIYVVVQRCCMGKAFSASHVWLSILGWKSVGNSNWYIFAIVLLYALTFLSFWAFDRPRYPHVPLIALTLLTIVLMAILSTARPTYCYNTLMAYVAGAWFYGWKRNFDEIFLANHRAWTVSLVGFVLAFCLLQPYWKSTLVCSGASLAFAFAIVLISAKIISRNAVLSYCGRHLFSLYILQRLPMVILQKTEVAKAHKYGYFLVCLAATFIIAAAFDLIVPWVWGLLSRLFRKIPFRMHV